MNITRLLVMAVSLFSIPNLCLANDAGEMAAINYVKPVVGIGLNLGGDTIDEYNVDYYYGDEGTEDVKAGEGIHMFGGVELGYPSSNLAIRLQAGYLFSGIFADNGDVSFSRVPLEAIMFLTSSKFKVGVGLSHHTNVELDDDVDDGVSSSAAFEDATGFLFQGEYWFTQVFGLGLRFTKIEYEQEDVAGSEFDGTGGGIYSTFAF